MREVLEETGIKLPAQTVTFAAVNNNVMESENKHYITIFMKAHVSDEVEAQNMEPHKCEGWMWVRLPTSTSGSPQKVQGFRVFIEFE